jgi:hypothetical protein
VCLGAALRGARDQHVRCEGNGEAQNQTDEEQHPGAAPHGCHTADEGGQRREEYAQPVGNVVAEILPAGPLRGPRHGVVSDAAELGKPSYHECDDEDEANEDAG